MGTQGYLLMAESVVENTRPTPPTLPTNMVLRVLNFGIKAVVEMRRGCEEHTQSCWVRNEVEVFTESQSSPSLINHGAMLCGGSVSPPASCLSQL